MYILYSYILRTGIRAYDDVSCGDARRCSLSICSYSEWNKMHFKGRRLACAGAGFKGHADCAAVRGMYNVMPFVSGGGGVLISTPVASVGRTLVSTKLRMDSIYFRTSCMV